MTDLISRLAAAPGPDCGLDDEIYWLISEWKNVGGWWREHKVTGVRERFGYGNAPNYTESLDAALTLVPEDAFWTILTAGSQSGVFQAAVISKAMPEALKYIEAATPALALCIAALRARGLGEP